MKAVLKGTTRQCLAHLAKLLGSLHATAVMEVEEELRKLTKLSGTRVVHRWLQGESFPNSLRLLQLRFFLTACGYDVEELRTLHAGVRSFARLIAFGYIDANQAQMVIGYKQIDDFWIALLGKSTPTKERRAKMKNFAAKNENQVEQTYRILVDQLANLLRVSPVVHATLPVPKRPKTVSELNTSEVLKAAAALINALGPLAHLILFDHRFTAVDREQLHTLTGDDGIFNLSNDINGLCSESARRTRLSHEEKTR